MKMIAKADINKDKYQVTFKSNYTVNAMYPVKSTSLMDGRVVPLSLKTLIFYH
jgi:hypothetical protein